MRDSWLHWEVQQLFCSCTHMVLYKRAFITKHLLWLQVSGNACMEDLVHHHQCFICNPLQVRWLCGPWWSWPLRDTLWSANPWEASSSRLLTLEPGSLSPGSWRLPVPPPHWLAGPGTFKGSLTSPEAARSVQCNTDREVSVTWWSLNLNFPTVYHVNSGKIRHLTLHVSDFLITSLTIDVHVFSTGTSQRACSAPVDQTTTPWPRATTTSHTSCTCSPATSYSQSSSSSSLMEALC